MRRAALVRLRCGIRAGPQRSARAYTTRLYTKPRPDAKDESAGRRPAPPSALERSISKDIAALEAIRSAFAAGSAQDAAFQQSASRLLQCSRDCRRVFATGMGKSGIVARRLASSLASISIASQWVHGGEWVHGELGSLQAGDVVVILSHSGSTAELLALPSRFQDAGCCVVAIVGNAESPLAVASDFVLAVEAQDDAACPVPSRSIVAQEAMCNALVEHLVGSLGDSATKLQQSHPGGAIGRLFKSVDP